MKEEIKIDLPLRLSTRQVFLFINASCRTKLAPVNPQFSHSSAEGVWIDLQEFCSTALAFDFAYLRQQRFFSIWRMLA
jgi:hypothetical protein